MQRLENCDVKSWKQFVRTVRSRDCNLLKTLNTYSRPILVSGVQRSGTTVVTRAINQSQEVKKFWVNQDDELDAALMLSGYVEHETPGRYCFQTTYLNDCVNEYSETSADYKLIWVVRNPYSVIYSMVYNWKRFALNNLFYAVGTKLLDDRRRKRFDRFGGMAISQFRKACYAYNGKALQLLYLKKMLPAEKLLIVDYDDILEDRSSQLMRIYRFVELEYQENYSDIIRINGTDKAKGLSPSQRELISEICLPVYEETRML